MINFASKEEKYFYWYLDELIKRNIVVAFKYQPKLFILADPVSVSYQKQLKTKAKTVNTGFLQDHTYQADFLLYWNPEYHGKIFVGHEDSLDCSIKKYPFIANFSNQKKCYYSVVDVKGTYNQNDAWRRFSIEQKWVFQKYGIYVQKIITHPQVTKEGKMIPATALFPNTFVPKRFLLTDKSEAKRKINYDTTSIKVYIQKLSFL